MHNESPPIILSNYLDRNLFQTAVLGQVKWRQFKQIDLSIPLKKNKADSQRWRSRPSARPGCGTSFFILAENGGKSYFPMNFCRWLFMFPFILIVHHSCVFIWFTLLRHIAPTEPDDLEAAGAAWQCEGKKAGPVCVFVLTFN